MPTTADFAAIGGERFVSLTTFRRSGAPVATPVWIGRDAHGDLLVTTPAGTGKVKRLRNNSRVEMRPCSMRGRVEDGAPVVAGIAEIVTDDASRERLNRVFLAKYGFQYRITTIVERFGKSSRTQRVVLRIAPVPEG